MDQRPLLPQAEARRHGQNQGDGFDQQGPLPQVSPDDEAAQDGLDLRQTRTQRINPALTQSAVGGSRFRTSGIPDPQAYGANTRTNDTARKENSSAHRMYRR